MLAGKLRCWVTIQQIGTAQDASGQVVDSWSTVATRWASIEPLSGREYFAARQFQAQVNIRVRLRYLAGIVAKMRILYETRVFDIEAVIDPGERHAESKAHPGARSPKRHPNR